MIGLSVVVAPVVLKVVVFEIYMVALLVTQTVAYPCHCRKLIFNIIILFSLFSK